MDDGRFRGRPLSFWDYSGPQGSRYSFDGGALAQLGERRLCKPEVTGSSPVRSMAETHWKRGFLGFWRGNGGQGVQAFLQALALRWFAGPLNRSSSQPRSMRGSGERVAKYGDRRAPYEERTSVADILVDEAEWRGSLGPL